MSDLGKYVAGRKKNDKVFAHGYEEQYECFKISARVHRRIFLLLSLCLVFWCSSYIILRATRFLVRREWLEIHSYSTYQREIYASDIGRGGYFDADFKPKRDFFRAVYFPLWRMELTVRGKYFYHDDVAPVHVLDRYVEIDDDSK